ncbi:hypothetical protein E8E14_006865 [Neopestalotiopsis sp. 37M]|nr:hypothetical protein E8E14_006865 [Neopestalotiopsis sp. 37M]
MAINAANWRPLPSFQNVPPLLVRLVFTLQSYSVHITDLANLWVEDLDRKGIGRRSLNEDTSIDPTEGPDQMRMLLTKIQAALDPSAPDHDQTSISIATVPKNGDTVLALTITCQLPDGLKPLVWTFQMSKCPTTSIAPELVLPMVQKLQTRTQQIDELVKLMKVKEGIIDKLIDKLDRAGLGLENVWNVLSSKRNPSREYAEEKITGLAPLKQESWQLPDLPRTQELDGIVSLATTALIGPENSKSPEARPSDVLDDWWGRLGTKPVKSVPRTTPSSGSTVKADVPPEKSRLAADSDTDTDDFQVQATPPHLASAQKRRTEADLDATTDDGGDAIPDSHPVVTRPAKSRLGGIGKWQTAASPPATQSRPEITVDADDTASEPEEEPVKSPPRQQKTGRIGMIGGKKPDPEISKADSLPQRHRVADDEDKTASESEGEKQGKNTSPASPPAGSSQRRRIGAIGRIGGIGGQAPVQPNRKSPTPDTEPTESTGRRIGAIGKRKLDKETQSVTDSKSPDESEDDEQRAERKRAELAKELERKANAKPTKKKRKF